MKHCLAYIRTIGLLATMAGTALSADVNFIAVVNGQNFKQAGSNLVALINSDYDKPLAFSAFAEGAAIDSLASGTLQMPNGTTVPLVREYPDDWGIRHEYQSESLLDLNTTRSNGTYILNLVTKNDGTKNVSLSLTNDTYPSVPVVTNFNVLQTITNTAVTTIRWAPMTNGTAADFILFSVYDNNTDETVFETGSPGTTDALTGTNVFATIPANTLESGRTYEGELLFVKVVNVNKTSYQGVLAIAGYYKQAGFEIKTVATPGVTLGSELVSSLPQNYAGDVPRDSAISFRFSQPMSTTNKAITWVTDGIAVTNFNYEWIDGNKVLLCRCTTTLPADSDIGWTLNLTGFRDANRFPLTGSIEGSFHTSSADPLSPPDVTFFSVLKMRGYQQTGTNPVSTGMYGCDASVDMAAYNRVKQGTLTVVSNGFRGSLVADDWDPHMGMEATYASQTDLDRFFANGDFTFSLTNLADGAKNLTLSLGSTNDYPAAPTVTNLPALQTVNPALPVTIYWNAPANWSNTLTAGRCIIELAVENLPQEDEVIWIDFSSITNSSKHTFPVGTFWPGRTYRLSLQFITVKDVDIASYSGATGAAGFESITEFTLQTTGTVIKPTVAMSRDGDNLTLNMSGGEPQRSYILATSTDLQRWMPQAEIWLSDFQTNQWYDNDAQYFKKRFYRLRDRARGEFVQQNIAIQGTVYAYSTPVAGAVVSTSLDAQTAITDSSGRFFLETDTPSYGGMNSYTITVISGETHKDFGPWQWGDQPREQTFEMN